MTELYDDCNWVNKNHAYKLNDVSWVNAAHRLLEDKFIKQQKLLIFNDMMEMGEGIARAAEQGIRRVNPMSQEGFEAFEKWREGLDWGDKKRTDDNCTGDLILP